MATTDSSAILQELLGEIETAVTKRPETIEDAGELALKIDNVQKELDEAAKIRDTRVREARIRVLNATFDELRKHSKKRQEDLARAMFGLQAYIEKFGEVYKNLGEPTTADKALLQNAQEEIRLAEEELKEAEEKLFFKGRATTSARARIETAQQTLAELQKEVQARTREKLLSSNLDELTQQFLLWSGKTATSLKSDISDLGEQIKIVVTRKTESLRIQKDAAQAFEKFDKDLKAKEADLKAAEEKLLELENGTSEYAVHSALVSDLRSEVEDLGGKVNQAMVLADSKEKYVSQLIANEIAHRKTRENARVFLTILTSSSEDRVVLFKSRLELEIKAANQELSKQIHTMGTDIDLDNLEAVVARGAAGDRLINEVLKELPATSRQIAAVLASQAEAHAGMRMERQDVIDELRQRYGIDLSERSFFHYVKKDKAKPEEEAAHF